MRAFPNNSMIVFPLSDCGDRKSPSINKLNSLDSQKAWPLYCVTPTNKLLLCKPYVRIGEEKKKHFKDHFNLFWCQPTRSLLKELNPSQLVLKQETY